MKKLAVAASLAALLAACSTAPTTPAPVSEPAAPAAKSDIPTAPAPVAVTADPFKGFDKLDSNPALAKRSVYFDFDKYDVKDEYLDMLGNHAKFLKATSEAKVLVQGNTDERGSREYNLALGQKRAEAVANNLKMSGVPEDQVEAVSLGEEKPKATGHDEAAWAENRRADLVYSKR